MFFLMEKTQLIFSNLLAISADGKRKVLFLFISKNRVWHFMQTVSSGDSLHEIANPILVEKYEKYFKMSAEWKAQHAKQQDLTFK